MTSAFQQPLLLSWSNGANNTPRPPIVRWVMGICNICVKFDTFRPTKISTPQYLKYSVRAELGRTTHTTVAEQGKVVEASIHVFAEKHTDKSRERQRQRGVQRRGCSECKVFVKHVLRAVKARTTVFTDASLGRTQHNTLSVSALQKTADKLVSLPDVGSFEESISEGLHQFCRPSSRKLWNRPSKLLIPSTSRTNYFTILTIC